MTAGALDVLVAGATQEEMSGVYAALERAQQGDMGGRPWTEGQIGCLQVGVLATGVGKVNAALALGATLAARRTGLLLSVGVGGAYPGSGLRTGDLAVAAEENYGDEGAQGREGFLDMEELGIPSWEGVEGPCFNRFPADQEVRAALLSAARVVGRAACGPFVTVSTVTGTQARAEALEKRFSAVCESMEGAAVAHAAVSRGVPFGEVRGISNAVGPRDRPSWRLAEASAAAGEAVVLFLRSGWSPGSAARPD